MELITLLLSYGLDGEITAIIAGAISTVIAGVVGFFRKRKLVKDTREQMGAEIITEQQAESIAIRKRNEARRNDIANQSRNSNNSRTGPLLRLRNKYGSRKSNRNK